jgi:uncharacterized protein YndB with AHSA1/START domain
MPARNVVHGQFTISRNWKVAPERVFAAFADEAAKDKWFGGLPGWEKLKKSFDFREGGHEHLSGRHPNGTVSTFDCIYRDIVPNERIVYSYVMHLDGKKISVSQACIEFKPEAAGTRLVVREDGIFLDGYDDNGSREHGTNLLMDLLGKSIGA